MFYRTIKVIFFILVLGVLAKGWQGWTEGFRIDKIYPRPALFEGIDPPVDENEANLQPLKAILGQRFTYLGKGCQVYAFVSEDGRYVIKFPRYHRYSLPPWKRMSMPLPFWEKIRKKKVRHKRNSLCNALASYSIAKENLCKETGLLFSHLYPTQHLHQKITLVDFLGREYEVELDRVGFLLQKKAENLEATLLSLREKQDLVQSQAIVSSFLDMIVSLFEKGIVISDRNCVRNAGILGHEVVAIDLGSFHRKDLQNPQVFSWEVHSLTRHFCHWLKKHYPEMLPFFQERVDQIIQEKQEVNV